MAKKKSPKYKPKKEVKKILKEKKKSDKKIPSTQSFRDAQKGFARPNPKKKMGKKK